LAAAKRVRQVGSAVIAGLGNRPAVASNPIVQDVDCCEVHANIRRSLFTRTLPVNDDIPAAPFVGSRVLTDIPVAAVFEFMNERTLFGTQWQFRKNGVPPREYARQMREIAEPALARLKEQCLAENILQPASVIGFFPAVADGDDLMVGSERFTFPRQDHGEHLCLSDFHRPDAGDFVAMMAVTAGAEVSRRCWELKESGEYQDYLFLHGLGVEFAEALAEWTHREIRRLWGIAGQDSPDPKKLFKKHYRGCRYSFGYPACPRLEDQAGLFRLLDPQRIGIALSEQFQLEPEQSTTAMVVHHPQAKYFNVTLSR
jgi:5-methyltetrahydrofolate--homocysteine methyltransferase